MAGRTKVVIGAVVTYIAGAAIAYQYISKDSNENNNTNSKVPQKITIDENHRQKTYAKMAPHFDQRKSLESSPSIALLSPLEKKLVETK
jgi:methionine-rich copper-binding protein CopC